MTIYPLSNSDLINELAIRYALWDAFTNSAKTREVENTLAIEYMFYKIVLFRHVLDKVDFDYWLPRAANGEYSTDPTDVQICRCVRFEYEQDARRFLNVFDAVYQGYEPTDPFNGRLVKNDNISDDWHSFRSDKTLTDEDVSRVFQFTRGHFAVKESHLYLQSNDDAVRLRLKGMLGDLSFTMLNQSTNGNSSQRVV